MVTLLPAVTCVWYHGLQFRELGILGTVHVPYYCATQTRSFSEMCVYARRFVQCYKLRWFWGLDSSAIYSDADSQYICIRPSRYTLIRIRTGNCCPPLCFCSEYKPSLKMRPICCPETSVSNYHPAPRNIPEDPRPQYSSMLLEYERVAGTPGQGSSRNESLERQAKSRPDK